MKYTPIIIIGMHRSGTTMLSKILENSGVFLGNNKDINNEALFFQKINTWVMRQVYASWDNPEPILHMNQNELNYLKKICLGKIQGMQTYSFLGLQRFLRSNKLTDINTRWGWKDPRNTFTLPIWKSIFPDSRIIHIYRNPVDVANSLKYRAGNKELFNSKMSFKNYIKIFLLSGKITGYRSIKVRNLYDSYLLWSSYVRRAFEYNNIMHVKYEELLDNPNKILNSLFEYLDIEINENMISDYSSRFNKDRKYAFLKDDKLCSFYEDIRKSRLLKELGYSSMKKCN